MCRSRKRSAGNFRIRILAFVRRHLQNKKRGCHKTGFCICCDRCNDCDLKYVLPCSNQGITMVTTVSMKANRKPIFGQLWKLEFILSSFPYCTQQIIDVELIKLMLSRLCKESQAKVNLYDRLYSPEKDSRRGHKSIKAASPLSMFRPQVH